MNFRNWSIILTSHLLTNELTSDLARGPWANQFLSLNLIFFSYKMKGVELDDLEGPFQTQYRMFNAFYCLAMYENSLPGSLCSYILLAGFGSFS